MNNAAIGIFDSGFGGLTVARAIHRRMPNESILYFGDSARCPYGPRDQEEVRGFVREICSKFIEQDVKLIVIACNTATAAGLSMAQKEFDVPIVGVVEPGARAAVRTTRKRKIGVLATKGTVDSNAYVKALQRYDAGVLVTQQAASRFVELAEAKFSGKLDDVVLQNALKEYCQPLIDAHVDTVVLGCTHFPLLQDEIQAAFGKCVSLISSATETARDVDHILQYRNHLCSPDINAKCAFNTSGKDKKKFQRICRHILGNCS